MIVTSFRSGSSFLGDLLQQSDPRSYFFYEPLHFLTSDVRAKNRDLQTVNHLVQNLFRCNYGAEPRFVRHLFGRIYTYLITRSDYVDKICKSKSLNGLTCRNLHLLQEICRRSHVQIMKFTRLNLADAVKLDLPAGTKILYLQRDPRAIYNSRKTRNWCQKKECRNISALCEERKNDLLTLQQSPNNQIIVTRFEDLALNPMQESERLFNVLGLQHTDNVKGFLRTHTQGKGKKAESDSTKRNSSAVATRWRTQLSKQEIMQLQRSCDYVLKNAGYDFI